MDTKSLDSVMTQFVYGVTEEFKLAEVVSVLEMAGSANRLWQFITTTGNFVVKELPYDDKEQYFELRKAATFEATVLAERRVHGPAPVPNRSGEYVSVLRNSRGQESPVRLHPWFTGTPPRVDDPFTLVQAGRTLRAIQKAGSTWSIQPRGSLRRWETEPVSVLERFLASGYWDGDSSIAPPPTHRHAIADALALVRAGESMPDDWIYTHRDHKPENCLIQDSVLAILDWDECHYCNPRLEAVESALRWSGSDNPNPESFTAFMTGYNDSGMTIETLSDQDFAKWIAGLLEWFCFQARRTVGDWSEVTETERITAAALACDALSTLQESLSAIPRWTHLL